MSELKNINGPVNIVGEVEATSLDINGDANISGTLSGNFVVRSTNNANVDGANFAVDTTNKTSAEYAYEVLRSGTTVAGITMVGKITGTELEGTSLDINGNADISGTLNVGGADAITITDYILHAGDDSKFGFPSNDNFKIRLAGVDRFNMSTTTATFAGSGTFNTTLNVNAPDEGGAPAMTAVTNMHGYEGRGVGIKMRDSANSASSPSNREWFVGTGYNQSGFNIGYASDGSQSSYTAQAKLSIGTDGNAVFAGTVTPSGNAAKDLGGASNRWATVYASNVNTNTSSTFGGDIVLDDNVDHSPNLYFYNQANNYARLYFDTNDDLLFKIGTSTELTLDGTSATFAGDLTVNGTAQLGNALTDKAIVHGHLGIGHEAYPKIAYPGQNALWGESNNSTVGQVVIDLPGTLANYDMTYMEIDIYEYNSSNATKLIIGGHNWNSSGNSGTGNLMWHNRGVTILGYFDKSIYFGWRNDGTNNRRVIAIGEVDSTWNYPTIHVAKVHGNDGYSSAIDWVGDWAMNLTTSSSFFTKSPTTNFNTTTINTFKTPGIINPVGGIAFDGNTITGIDDSDEFTNDDSHLMTSAAIEDKILSYGYGSGSGSGDVTLAGTQTFTGSKTFSGGINITDDIVHSGDADTKIGFTTDTFKAYVGGNDMLRVETSGTVLLSDGGNANGAALYLKHTNNNTEDTISTIFFGNNADSTLSSIVTETSGANNTSKLVFNTSTTGTLASYMTIDGVSEIVRVHKPLWITEYITHIGDTNTFFGFSGADTFVVHAGASGHAELTIDSTSATFAGDVTINGSHLTLANGTTSAAATDYLYIGGSGLASADAAIYIGNGGGNTADGYGYRIFYYGGGSGNNNKLIFKSENYQSAEVDMLTFTADGKSTFSQDATFSGNTFVNAQLAVNSTSVNAANKLEVHGQARVNGTMMIGNSSISNTTSTGQLHIKNTGGAVIRLEDSDNSNLAFDLISDEGVGFMIKETVGGDSGDDIRLTIAESTGNATFGSSVTANGGLVLPSVNDTHNFKAFGGDSDSYFQLSDDANNSVNVLLTRSDGAEVFKIMGHTQAATFGGTVETGGDLTVGGTGGIFIPEYIYHTGDTNTYLGFPSNNDTIVFATNGSTALTLDASNVATFAGNLTVGVDDTGHDVKFFGATSGRYMEWDESADSLILVDNVQLQLGSSSDIRILHDGTDSKIRSTTSDLYITQEANDKDIIFQNDDGSGGLETYFFLDGSTGHTQFPDAKKLQFGSSNDMFIEHDGSNSYISSDVGTFYIRQTLNDGDLVLTCDDGSGGNTAYITLDGSHTKTIMGKTVHFDDNVKIQMGDYANPDLEIYHNGSHSYIDGNTTGDLYIRSTNDDVVIQGADDVFIYAQGGEDAIIARGNGAVELYYDNAKKLETYNAGVGITGNAYLTSGNHIHFDNGVTNNYYVRKNSSTLEFKTGGTYNFLSGNATFAGDVNLADAKKLQLGASQDLQIYHDGANSYIVDYGTGDMLNYYSNDWKLIKLGSGELSIWATTDAGVKLYYDNSLKLETVAAGVKTSYAATSSTDGDAAGDIVYFSETSTTAGRIYYYTSAGAWELADADAQSSASGMLAVALGSSSSTHGMLLRGMVTLNHDPGAVGDTLFLSTAIGQATATAPSGAGDIVRVIGYCLHASTGQIWFNPDGAFVEVTAG